MKQKISSAEFAQVLGAVPETLRKQASYIDQLERERSS